MATLKGNRGGGVAIYSKESMAIEIEEIHVKNIEGMMCKICNGKYRLILIYRPSMYATAPFIKNLVGLVQHVRHLKDVEGTIIMGDFNENILIKVSDFSRKPFCFRFVFSLLFFIFLLSFLPLSLSITSSIFNRFILNFQHTFRITK